MKRRIAALLLAMSLLLTGCSWPDGHYVSVKPHQEQRQEGHSAVVSASELQELVAALKNMVSAGGESGVINVAEYPQHLLDAGMILVPTTAFRQWR